MAVVAVQIYKWSARRAGKHLEDAGMRVTDSGVHTPDGEYRVGYVGVTDYRLDAGRKFVEVTFADASPRFASVVDCSDCSD